MPNVCGPPDRASALCRSVYDLTHNAAAARAADLVLLKPVKIALIVALAALVTLVLRRAINRFVRGLARGAEGKTSSRGAQRAGTVAAILRSAATVTVWTIALAMILGELGVDLAPLIAGAGIIGIALGFGAQNLVRDFLSGIFMLVEDQFGVGDVIDAGPATGTVEGITLRTTRLRDIEGNVWHIPNGTIARVANKSQQWSRALLDVEVAYSTDTDKAESVIKRVADDVAADPEWEGRVLDEPSVWGVESLGDSSVAIRLVVTTRPLAQWEVARELRARLKSAFAEEGIEIPFPQQVVRLHSADDHQS